MVTNGSKQEAGTSPRILTLRLKDEYWQKIRLGTKSVEYRRYNDYWKKRIEGREYDEVHLVRGFPPKHIADSWTLRKKWKGSTVETITHKEFGPNGIEVFAIDVSEDA